MKMREFAVSLATFSLMIGIAFTFLLWDTFRVAFASPTKSVEIFVNHYSEAYIEVLVIPLVLGLQLASLLVFIRWIGK